MSSEDNYKDAKVKVSYLAIAVVVSVLIATISGLAIHQTSTNVSDGYNNTVKVIAWSCIAGAFACLVALPSMVVDRIGARLLVMFLAGVVLCVAVTAVSGFALHLAEQPVASTSYVNAVRGVAGTALALSLASIIFVPVLYKYEEKNGPIGLSQTKGKGNSNRSPFE
jgi:hypothetical protein